MKKKLFSILLCLAMALSIIGTAQPKSAEAASAKISKKKVTVYVGDTYKLKLKNASGDVTWNSSKTSVATVKKGTVTAKKAGKATITATYNDKAYKCKVTVKEFEKAAAAVVNMKIGWNLGNYFDSTGRWLTGKDAEGFMTGWGNPIVDESLFKRLKEMGFGAVRVPVTWQYHFDEEGNIDPVWMSKVKEVVDWVLANDMYCIINVHHDTGEVESDRDKWLFASMDNFNKNHEIYSRIWAQIAAEFKDYPEQLLFEGFNEMLDENSNWGEPGEEATEAINAYNQRFVDTVRKSGGKNATRNLICNTYAAGITENSLYLYAAPSDTVKDHLIGEVHFYEPYTFTILKDTNKITGEDEDTIDAVMDMAGEAFKTRGYDADKGKKTAMPLIIGEFGANNNGNNTSERIKWYTKVIESAKRWNITCFIWDDGNSAENMGLINRTGTQNPYPDILKACLDAANK